MHHPPTVSHLHVGNLYSRHHPSPDPSTCLTRTSGMFITTDSPFFWFDCCHSGLF